jgi:CHAD domain-containing protein
MIETDRIELELSGAGTTPAHVTVGRLPRVPSDLPPGPFRARIAAMIEARALLPQVRISSLRTGGALRNADDKVVAVAELHDEVRVLDPAVPPEVGSTIEIHEVPGYDKQTRVALDALRRLELVEFEADTLTLCASAAGIHLDGFSASATVPLDPSMSAIEGFRQVLANLAATIDANWQGTVEQIDPEFLHDLRIAMRRTRTILAAAKNVLPDEVLDHARSEFAWLAGLTGEPRDLDVYLLEWSRYTEPLGSEAARQLEPVRDLLEQRCEEVHAELELGLGSERAEAVMSRWRAWLAEPIGIEEMPPQGGRPLGRVVAKRIGRAHEVLLERGRLIGPDTPAEQVHDLRKDAKKLRYLLECFGSLLHEDSRKQYVKRLKALQDNLGEHQDAAVHVDMLHDIVRHLGETSAPAGTPTLDTMVAIGRLTERLDQQRRAARSEFADRFADYDTPKTQHALDGVIEGMNG